MQNQPKETQPPSYASAISQRDEMISLATRVIEDASHSPFGDASAFSISRLRNFLCYVMVVDYSAAVPHEVITLSAADSEHFNQVFVTLDRFRACTLEMSLNDDEKVALGAYFWEHVHAPSRALGLPSEAVMVCIRRFALYKSNIGTYKGCGWGVIHTHGMREWAGKLLMDRRTIIPRVAPTPAIEQHLLEKNKLSTERWFDRLDGFDYEIALYPGVGTRNGVCHAEFNAFELSERAKRFQMRQKMSMELREQHQESREGIAHLYDEQTCCPCHTSRKTGELAYHRVLWDKVKQRLSAMERKFSDNRLNRLHNSPLSYPDRNPPVPIQGAEELFMDNRAVHRMNPNFFSDQCAWASDHL